MHGHQLKEVASGETNAHWLERREKAIPKGVAHACPIFAQRAENAEVWDIEGNRYIDFCRRYRRVEYRPRPPKGDCGC